LAVRVDGWAPKTEGEQTAPSAREGRRTQLRRLPEVERGRGRRGERWVVVPGAVVEVRAKVVVVRGAGGTMRLTVEQNQRTPLSPSEAAEAVRIRRLREDARRPISVNLAETIALSHALIKMAGAARRG
jgi:hypothetical protein